MLEVWAPKIYVGSPEMMGVMRKSNNEVIGCSEKDFSQLVCLKAEDYQKLHEGCLD